MNLSKASWRCKSPRRKIQAIRKIRHGDTSEAILAAIVASDSDEQVRTAAAHRLCSIVASIASHINSCFTDSEGYTEDDECRFAFVAALVRSIEDDAYLFDIAMHADFGLTDTEPEHLQHRWEKSLAIRVEAAEKMDTTSALRARIVMHWQSVPKDVAWAAVGLLRDNKMLAEIMSDKKMAIDLAIRAAYTIIHSAFIGDGQEKMQELANAFLTAVARDERHKDGTRLLAAYYISTEELRQAVLLEILESPRPEDDRFQGASRSHYTIYIKDKSIRLALHEKIARDSAYSFGSRFEADQDNVQKVSHI